MNTLTPRQLQLRRDRDALLRELEIAGVSNWRGSSCCCPYHEDRHPSAGVFLDDEGSWKFRCQRCGFSLDVFDVRARNAGKPLGHVLAEYRDEPAAYKPAATRSAADVASIRSMYRSAEAVYAYANPEGGSIDMVVVRIRESGGGKTFRQWRPRVGGGFEEKAPAKPWPVYNRTRVCGAERVVIVEGEKCVHALHAVGIVATTSPGGAGKAACADWTPLAGKECVLWPDNDPPNPPDRPNPGERTGLKHMREVAGILQSLVPPARVLWIEPDELGIDDKGDVVDYIAEYGGDRVEDQRRAVETIISTASPVGPADDLAEMIEDSIAGRRRLIPFPWSAMTNMTRALFPGSVTLLAGDPGCGKSFLLLEAAWRWHEQQSNVRVAFLAMEDERAYHLNRVLSQREGNSDLTDAEWVRLHPDEARQSLARHRAFMDSLAPVIETPSEDWTLAGVLEWVQAKATAGCDVIVVDPVTAARQDGDRSWQDDRDFIIKAKAIVKASGSRLVISTHPKLGTKSGGKASPLHAMAGGAAYPRFAHTVLWISTPERPWRVKVEGMGNIEFEVVVNRVIKLGKTRNGPGSGTQLGYIFEPESLRFVEQGTIIEDAERGPKLDEPMPRAPLASAVQDPFSDEDAP